MKINRDDLARFFDRKGFYLILFLCIVVVAATAVYVTNNNLKKMAELNTAQEKLSTTNANSSSKNLITEYPTTNNSSSAVKEESKTKVENTKSQSVASSNKSDASSVTYKAASTKTQENNTVNTMSNSTAVSTEAKSENDTKLSLMKPVNGDVIMEFAVTKLTYSKTLDEWTTHKGVDLKADLGTEVVAAMGGVVTKVYSDSRLGNTVEIKNGAYITRYSNLDDNINVKVGQTVEKGSTIGKVGKTAKFEIAEDPHVHFELLKDGTYIDPMQYFK
ncbi:M23 family metallopeptidase [Thermoanaerobacterium butyriciformans]|uniref:Murein DD-endopeptidase MepM/ murein hydrolase activator NlpD n=1 Tax=Thermoanaerobacterium butyriciformans TaxID=1702242 RepID=A0ABS4NFK9_9THEO|nr:M23 family metallopeptidase [Thermoanaerobacterium butyriciformans]MBP2072468.1 murein DD-endopeptidase MepM/ murein hydrolase activator NlpD [Thermoanaerobacterium butyriciformans]